MDCCHLEQCRSPFARRGVPMVSSPEMFDSDPESEENNHGLIEDDKEKTTLSPERPSEAELIARSDNYLLARINKFLSGVPPPPKHTICRSDCSEFLLRIYENRSFFWAEAALPTERQVDDPNKSPDQSKENLCRNLPYQSLRNAPRNLSHAFDQCDLQCQNTPTTTMNTSNLTVNSQFNAGTKKLQSVLPNSWIRTNEDRVSKDSNAAEETYSRRESERKEPCPNRISSGALLYCTVSEKEASQLTWPDVYQHKSHGLHYNTTKAIEEFENLTVKLCERYIGAETQSTCSVWFSKQAPGSARKRSLLAKRENGQSPGKRLSHLTRRRRTFSSANLQGLGLSEKKQLVLNIKKPYSRKGKSPRGKSPRGKSPRGKSPRSSTKKKVVRRLTLDGPSPVKAKIETSKRALFQSPTSDRAGPSKLFTGSTNPQNIKRALFPTPKKREDDADRLKRNFIDDSRKRKNEEELEGPRLKWAKSLSFDCTGELYNNSMVSWANNKHSSSSLIETSKPAFTPTRTELSDTHRKKLLWAVAEALRSKGIGMNHPQFKQYASNLARTIKKFMPDLENRNIPRKPGSTSDRMLKLAKHHVLFIIETRPAD